MGAVAAVSEGPSAAPSAAGAAETPSAATLAASSAAVLEVLLPAACGQPALLLVADAAMEAVVQGDAAALP